jgi:hypothetical protein
VFLVVLVAVVVVVLGVLALFDHRARAHGHVLRDSRDMYRSERSVQRKVRASEKIQGRPILTDWNKPDGESSRRS